MRYRDGIAGIPFFANLVEPLSWLNPGFEHFPELDPNPIPFGIDPPTVGPFINCVELLKIKLY